MQGPDGLVVRGTPAQYKAWHAKFLGDGKLEDERGLLQIAPFGTTLKTFTELKICNKATGETSSMVVHVPEADDDGPNGFVFFILCEKNDFHARAISLAGKTLQFASESMQKDAPPVPTNYPLGTPFFSGSTRPNNLNPSHLLKTHESPGSHGKGYMLMQSAFHHLLQSM